MDGGVHCEFSFFHLLFLHPFLFFLLFLEEDFLVGRQTDRREKKRKDQLDCIRNESKEMEEEEADLRTHSDIHIYYFQKNPTQLQFARELWERIRRECKSPIFPPPPFCKSPPTSS